jgi:putative ABC transport system permease protein
LGIQSCLCGDFGRLNMALDRISLREFSHRRLRTVLTIFSIAIGVASIVSVSMATSNARRAQQSMLRSLEGNSALELHTNLTTGFDAQSVARIASVPGVEHAVASLRRFSVMFASEDRRARVQLTGIDPRQDARARQYEIVLGNNLSDWDQALIDESLARSLKLEVGSQVRFATRSGIQTATIVGLLRPTGTAAILQGSAVLVPMPTAQRWFRSGNKIDSLQIIPKPNTDLAQLERDLARELPEGVHIRKPQIRSQMADETTFSTQQGLRLATGFSLIIAVFIIYNTFLMSVGERRRQLGILRALGATKKQLERMILREAVLLGVIGTLVGCVLGYAGAILLTRGTSRLMGVELVSMNVPWLSMLLATLAGIGLSLLGAYLPARLASRMSASEAMRVVSSQDFEKANPQLTWGGLVLLLLGLLGMLGCVFGWFIPDHATACALVAMVGCVLMLPQFLEVASQGIRRALGPWFQTEGTLAVRQLLRHRYRTSWTVAVLFLAMGTGLGMACTILDNIRNVQQWYKRTLVGDFYVRAAMPDMATGQSADMPDDLPQRLLNIPGIQSIDSMRMVNAQSGDGSVFVVARNFEDDTVSAMDLMQGDPATVLQAVRDGGVVVGSVLAERRAWKPGDMIPLATADGQASLKVVGIANDYLGGGLTMYMNRRQAESLLKIEGADAYIIQADDARLAEVGSALESLCDQTGLLLQSYADIVKTINRMMNGVIGGLWGVLALGSVIAAFGLVNTLAMNILEQSREIALLRVVAMTRGQIRKMVVSQAIMMGLIGLVPGTLMGILIGYLTNLSTLSVIGHAVDFHFRPILISGIFLAELVLVLLAALLPAQRAANMRLGSAVQYE